MNAIHRCILRLSGGRLGWEAVGMPMLELATVGRKSGEARATMPFGRRRYMGGLITARFDIPAMGGFGPILDALGTMARKVRTTGNG